MNAEFIVVGCRAGSPEGGVAASGYLLKTELSAILIDCGPGVAHELGRMALLDGLNAIIVSHRHADHCADLVALAYYRLFPHRRSALPLYGPSDLAQTQGALDTVFGIPTLPAMARPISDAFHFHPIEPRQTFCCSGVVVETLSARHPVPTLALRFPQWRLVYTADGALTAELVAFAQGASLVVADCTYVGRSERGLEAHGHMTPQAAARLAEEAGAERLLLTHLADYAQLEQARQDAQACTQAVVRVAQPGLSLALRAQG